MPHLELFCACVSQTCPKLSGMPKKGYFWDLGMLKFFPSKLMVIASSLSSSLASTGFHRNALLSESGGSLHSVVWTRQLIYPFPEEHLGCFPVLVMMSKAAVNIRGQIVV